MNADEFHEVEICLKKYSYAYLGNCQSIEQIIFKSKSLYTSYMKTVTTVCSIVTKFRGHCLKSTEKMLLVVLNNINSQTRFRWHRIKTTVCMVSFEQNAMHRSASMAQEDLFLSVDMK